MTEYIKNPTSIIPTLADDELSVLSWEDDDASSAISGIESYLEGISPFNSPSNDNNIERGVRNATIVSGSSSADTPLQSQQFLPSQCDYLYTQNRSFTFKGCDAGDFKAVVAPSNDAISFHETTLRLTEKMKRSAKSRAIVSSAICTVLMPCSQEPSPRKLVSTGKASTGKSSIHKASATCGKHRSLRCLKTHTDLISTTARHNENSVSEFLRSKKRC